MADARCAQPCHERRGVRTHPIAEDEHAGDGAVNTDQDVRLVCGRRGVVARLRRVSESTEVVEATDRDSVPGDVPVDAFARSLANHRGLGMAQTACDRGADNGFGHHVDGELLHRGRQAQELVLSEAVERDDALELWRAAGERAGLVEEHASGSGQLLESGATLDDHAAVMPAH
jgi:hypothetical protein